MLIILMENSISIKSSCIYKSTGMDVLSLLLYTAMRAIRKIYYNFHYIIKDERQMLHSSAGGCSRLLWPIAARHAGGESASPPR
jgi:hypothetical protein